MLSLAPVIGPAKAPGTGTAGGAPPGATDIGHAVDHRDCTLVTDLRTRLARKVWQNRMRCVIVRRARSAPVGHGGPTLPHRPSVGHATGPAVTGRGRMVARGLIRVLAQGLSRVTLPKPRIAPTAALCIVLSGTIGTADPARFPLLAEQPGAIAFDTGQDWLNFTAPSPPGVTWTRTDTPIEGPPELFTDVREVLVGRDPQTPDRVEIRVMAARIDPRRVLIAADYARVLAARWGRVNFGVVAHHPAFGEALVGDESSGAMRVTRLSALRRGDRVLIVASTFPAAGTQAEGPPGLAAFLGSLAFDVAGVPDLLDSLPVVATIPFDDGRGALDIRLPPTWVARDLVPPQETNLRGFVERDDPGGAFAVVSGLIPGDASSRAADDVVAPAALIGTAQAIAETMGRTFLPDGAFDVRGTQATTLPPFSNAGIPHGLFTFRIDRPAEATVGVTVMVSGRTGGPVVLAAVMSPYPTGPASEATFQHGKFLMLAQMQAQLAFWRARTVP
jgi:hypothetical protein